MESILRALIASCLFFQTGLADEKPERPPRPVKELVAILDKADLEVTSGGLRGPRELSPQQKLLSTWSISEIDLLLNHWEEDDSQDSLEYWIGPLIEQYAFVDEKPICQRLLSKEARIRSLAIAAGQGLDQNPSEAMLQSEFANLKALIRGWSRRDPKGAWDSLKGPDGCFFGSWLLKGYGYLLPRIIFEHLSQVDPAYAQSEFVAYSKVVHSEEMSGGLAKGLSNLLFQGSMLDGMGRGLPAGYDWRGLIEASLKIPRGDSHRVVQRLRGRILARWMQDDHKAAIAWFHSKAGETISIQKVEVYDDESPSEPIGVKTERVSLRFALRHWLANDKKGATSWLKVHPEMIEEILEKGAWVDPDSLTKRDLRQMLVEALSAKERDTLLLKLVKDKTAGRLLSELNRFPDQPVEEDFAVTKKEVEELNVSPEVAAKLLAFQKGQPDRSDPFGD